MVSDYESEDNAKGEPSNLFGGRPKVREVTDCLRPDEPRDRGSDRDRDLYPSRHGSSQ